MPTTMVATVFASGQGSRHGSYEVRHGPPSGMAADAVAGFHGFRACAIRLASSAVTKAWHATPAPEVAAELAAGPEGLTSDDARARLARYGPNRLPEAAGPSAVRLLADQLRSPLIWALLVAAGLALALGEVEDGLVVLAVVILNTLIGF